MIPAQQRLGGLLLEMGFIDQEQLRVALDQQARSGKRLGKILVESGLITEDRLVHALSRQLGIEACDPIMTPIHDSVLDLVPPEVAFMHRVLPVARQRETGGESLYVATADPLDSPALAALNDLLPETTELRWMLAGETEMDLALARHYGAAPPNFVDPETVAGHADGADSPEALQSTGDILTALREAVELSRDIPQKPPGSMGIEAAADTQEIAEGILTEDFAQQLSEVEAMLASRPGSPPRTGWSADLTTDTLATNGRKADDNWGDLLEAPGGSQDVTHTELLPEISVPVTSPVEKTHSDFGRLIEAALALPVADIDFRVDDEIDGSPLVTEDVDEVEGFGATTVARVGFSDGPTRLVVQGRAERVHAAILRFIQGGPLDDATRDELLRVVAAQLIDRGELSLASLRAFFDRGPGAHDKTS